MKHLKLYEQFDFEDFSDEELFGKNKGPYDDILKFGDDGPEFEAGDRIMLSTTLLRKGIEKGDTGTLVTWRPHQYLICFDDFVDGHDGDQYGNHHIPKKHGWWVHSEFMEII